MINKKTLTAACIACLFAVLIVWIDMIGLIDVMVSPPVDNDGKKVGRIFVVLECFACPQCSCTSDIYDDGTIVGRGVDGKLYVVTENAIGNGATMPWGILRVGPHEWKDYDAIRHD